MPTDTANAHLRQLLRTREVAERLAIDVRTVRRYVTDGLLPAIRIGGSVRFDPDDVDSVIAAGRTSGAGR
jgi:excisionase family DNA binding protein